MVKGISKRVVVVRFPDTRVFEQAIFIVREDAGLHNGVTADQVLQEACQAATGYMRRARRPKRKNIMAALLYGALGAAVMGLVWVVSLLL